MGQDHKWINKKQTWRLLVFLILAGIFALFSSDAIHGRWQFYLPKTILVNGNEVVVDDTLALNEMEEADFGRDKRGRATYSGGDTLTGMDVSVHQGKINWAQVAKDDIDFVFLRAGFRGYGSGEIAEDPTFAYNWKGVTAYKLPVGVYFFSQAVTPEEAREEARFTLALLDGKELDFPIVYDWEPVIQNYTAGDAVEPESIRTHGIAAETVTACALAFCEEVAAAGYDPMIYLNNDTGYFTYDIGQLQGLPVWFASYRTDWPDYYYAVQAWQYTETGTVAGVKGPVDLNLWFLPEREETGGNATAGNASP